MSDAAAVTEPQAQKHVTEHKHGGLGQLAATAICGNDITSSCLYVSALSILYAGAWAPICLLFVGVLLYLFRSVYGEVVGALPLNGGAYNALLNTTSKYRASIAACLTILSYMATAVISANEGMHYLHTLWGGLPVFEATIVLLAIFMVLTIIGVSESAIVAIGIFITHLVTLTLLLIVGGIFVWRNGIGMFNLNLSFPSLQGIGMAIFFGFSSAMLGISGFESSSNFVEEQAEGVFPKTLRNMWVAVTIFNPAMALLALAVIPSVFLIGGSTSGLLATLGEQTGGTWLKWLISIDAVLVLSGAVLTSFVGVNGLVRRMALDRCLPQLLLKTNKRKTTHRILIAFFLLTVSVQFITQGDLKTLAGIYTISFLSVMALFAIGNLLLKIKRSRLPRPEKAPWAFVLVGVAGVLTGLIGNIMLNPQYFKIFLQYFIPTMLAISVMMWRVGLLRFMMFFVRGSAGWVLRRAHNVSNWVKETTDAINSQQVVFFTRGDSVANLNEAMLYVRKNEHTNRIKVVNVYDAGGAPPSTLEKELEFLDQAYPEIDIEFVGIPGTFGPELIAELSEEWNIPKNFMFIGSPGDHFLYGLAELGGVRLII